MNKTSIRKKKARKKGVKKDKKPLKCYEATNAWIRGGINE